MQDDKKPAVKKEQFDPHKTVEKRAAEQTKQFAQPGQEKRG